MKCFNWYERFWRKSILFKGTKGYYMKHSKHMCGFQCFVLHIMHNEPERWHNEADDWRYQTILQSVTLLVWKLVSLFSYLESWKSSFVQYCIWNPLLIALVLNHLVIQSRKSKKLVNRSKTYCGDPLHLSFSFDQTNLRHP